MSLAEKIFDKLGIKSFDDLSDEERKTYFDWQTAFSGKETKLEVVEKYIETEIEKLENELESYEIERDRKRRLYVKARITNYKTILSLITSNQKKCEQLTTHLKKKFDI